MEKPAARQVVDALLRIPGNRSAVAAVEFAFLAPVFLFFMALLVDLGLAYSVKLKIVSATSAAAQYAFANGQSVNSANAAAFLSQVSTVATAAANLSPAPTVNVLLNNAAGGANAGNYYCVSGSSPSAATFTSTGTSSSSCGGNVMSGVFVTISLSATTSTIFYPQPVVGSVITEADAVIVRVK